MGRAMGQSLDRGHVLALSLWDDVEVNMLWVDSKYRLDKNASKPGVLRGDCQGGEFSTPTYLRNTYPNGYVTFANAAIGEIGSTLLGGSPAPSPGGGGSCGVGECQGVAECRDKDEAGCHHLANEGKCTWNPPVPCTTTELPPTPTPAPTPAPTPTPPPTPAPTTSPTPGLCKPWCSTNSAAWSKKCKWNKCEACSPCQATPGQCKSWCATNTQNWSKKCLWEKCSGCPDCTNGVRRLRGSNEELLV